MRFIPSLHSDYIAAHIPLPAVAAGKEKGATAFKKECLEVLFALSANQQQAENIIFTFSYALKKHLDFSL